MVFHVFAGKYAIGKGRLHTRCRVVRDAGGSGGGGMTGHAGSQGRLHHGVCLVAESNIRVQNRPVL